MVTSLELQFSQNHRIVGVGRDLWGSSGPTPLPKQGHLEQAAQDLIQVGIEYLQRRRLHNLSGQTLPVLFLSVFFWFGTLLLNSVLLRIFPRFEGQQG